MCEATQLSGEEELEVSQKSSPTRPFLDQRFNISSPRQRITMKVIPIVSLTKGWPNMEAWKR